MNRQILPKGKLKAKFLQQLIKALPTKDDSLIIPPGVGLDAAGLKISDKLLAITTDPITLANDKIGTYSVAINVNDVACLGCRPRWYSATLLLPVGTDVASVKKIWKGLILALKRYDIISIGGHIEVTDVVNQPTLVAQIIGESVTGKFLDSRKCKPGDKILLCMPVAIEGTALLAQEKAFELSKVFSKQEIKKMQNLLYSPGICIWPLVEKIVWQKGLVALHDPTEGGVATALHEFSDAANCGLNINGDSIPVLPETKKLMKLFDFDPLGLLASGSLLVACKPSAVKGIIKSIGDKYVSEIGEFTSHTSKNLYISGVKRDLPRYDKDEIVRLFEQT